jgi:hypothetical protein
MSRSSVPATNDTSVAPLLGRVNEAANAFLETAKTGAETIGQINQTYTMQLEGIEARATEHFGRAEAALENIGNAARYPTVVRNVLGLLGFDEFNTDLQRTRYQGATLNLQQLEQRTALYSRLREAAVNSIGQTVEAAKMRAQIEADNFSRSMAARGDARAERADARAEAEAGRAATRFEWETGAQNFQATVRQVNSMPTDALRTLIRTGPNDENRNIYGLAEQELLNRDAAMENLVTARSLNLSRDLELAEKFRQRFLTQAPAAVLNELLTNMKSAGVTTIERDGIKFTSRELTTALVAANDTEEKLTQQIYADAARLMQLGSRQLNMQDTVATLTTIPNAVTPGVLDTIQQGTELMNTAIRTSPKAASTVLEGTETRINEHVATVLKQFSPSKEVQQEVEGYIRNRGIPVATTALLTENISNPMAMEGTPFAAAWRAVSDRHSERMLQQSVMNLGAIGATSTIATGRAKSEDIMREALRSPVKFKDVNGEVNVPASEIITKSMYNDYATAIFASLAQTNPAFGTAIAQVRNDLLAQAISGNGKVTLTRDTLINNLVAVDKAMAIQYTAQVAEAAAKGLPKPPAPVGLTELYSRELLSAQNLRAYGQRQFANADINQRFFGTATGFFANGGLSNGALAQFAELNARVVTQQIRPAIGTNSLREASPLVRDAYRQTQPSDALRRNLQSLTPNSNFTLPGVLPIPMQER